MVYYISWNCWDNQHLVITIFLLKHLKQNQAPLSTYIYPIHHYRSLGGKLISLKPQRGPELSNRRSSAVKQPKITTPQGRGHFTPRIQGLIVDGWKKSHSQPPFGCKKWKKIVFLVGWTLPTSLNWWSPDFWTINSIMGLWRPLFVPL